MDRLAKLPHTSIRRFAAWLIAGNVAVGLVLGWLTLENLNTTRQADVQLATQIADNLSGSISTEISAELRLIDNALQSVMQQLPVAADAASSGFQARLALAVHEQSRLVPFVYAIRFADLGGTVDLGPDQKPINVADRDYFRKALASDGLVVSEPAVSRVSGEWVIVLARQVKGARGRPVGVLYAALLSRHFNALFSKIALGSGGAIALRTLDLNLVARFASGEAATDADLGTRRVSPTLLQALASEPLRGSFVAQTRLDGIERVNAYWRVPDFPLILLAGLSMEHFVSDWNRDARRLWGISALVMLLLAAGSAWAFVQHRREWRLSRHATRLAKQQSLMMENEWIGMLRVRQRTVIWTNQAVPRLLGYASESIVGSTTRAFYWDAETHERVGSEGYAQLQAKGSYHTQVEMKTREGAALWVDLSGVALEDGESAWTLVDITNIKRRESEAQHEALHDPLTGLANRRLFAEQVRLVQAQSLRSGQGWAICFLDLDGFKPINDSHGHDAGDEVLRAVAQRLQSTVRSSDFVARMGGDEFAIVLAGASRPSDIEPTARRCLEAVRRPITLSNGEVVGVGSSMGIGISADGKGDPHALLVAADEAMYEVKRTGKGQLVFAGGAA